MGAFLDKPKTEKEVSKGSGNGLKYGLSSMQGWRTEMEDAHCAIVGLPNGLTDWSFFAVFDGHAGARVSAHCADNLLDSIIQVEEFKANVEPGSEISAEQIELVKAGIRDGFLKLDEKMKKLPEVVSGEDKSGSTAVAGLISTKHLFLANCGDSRAVLSRAAKCVFSTLDHKPVNPEEKERIQRAGGSVMIQRVNGSLAVSRALGDYEYKQVEGKGPCEQLVSPEPEITVHERSNEDEFLILACDGVWDVMSNDDLCDFIRHQLTLTGDVDLICSSIIDTCLHKGSKDNMSVVLVTFPGAPQVSADAQRKDQELNTLLEKKVQEMVATSNNEITLNSLIQNLSYDSIDNLPPGAGIEAKRNVIEEIFVRLNPIVEDNSVNTDSN